MFLFLSKLIPSFLYPLGAVSLLLILSLFLLWKKSRWTPGAIGLSLIILLLSGNVWFSNWLVQSLEWQHIPSGDLPKADAIVVLGGGTRSQAYPRPDVDLSDAGDRVLYGGKLYREGKAPTIIVSGGRIEWRGSGQPESEDLSLILESMGVPRSAILQDPISYNTYENAVNVKQILQSHHLNSILLVTSAMHMPRSLAIFRHLGINAIAAPTDYRLSQLELEEPNRQAASAILGFVPEETRFLHTTHAIKEYIGLVIYKLRGWI
jgi:uncharacterized SAM-binding protein YcdF (DUF218 family)